MKFSTRSLRSPHTLVFSGGLIMLAFGLLITSTTADDGTQSRYTRVLPNGYVEVSHQPFTNSSFNTIISTWDSNPAFGTLGLNLSIREPESVGITHAYIPVSIEGSTCPIVRTQILLNASVYRNHRQSDILILSSSHQAEVVKVENLVPNTRYEYRILARGCNMTAATYKRELTTLKDPTPRYTYTQPKRSSPVIVIPEPAAVEPTIIEPAPVTAEPEVFEDDHLPTFEDLTPLFPEDETYSQDPYLEDPIITDESHSQNFFERIWAWIKRVWAQFLNTRDRSEVEVSQDVPDDVFVQETEPITEESYQDDAVFTQETKPIVEETAIERERGINLPNTAREWIAVILLIIGTAGIIGSFMSTRKKAE
ncbi:MAG TPA: hypothetical protein VGE63_00885 [Candidatus Paceibacterota bacterium]